MLWRKVLAGVAGGVALAGASGPQLMPAGAQNRMQLGAPSGPAAEFQSAVGDRVFFGEASAELGTRGRLALEAQAAWLLHYPHLSVIVEGHADDAGGGDHNLAISQQRAEVVRRRLIQLGVAPERIRTVAFGRERLIADCAAAACAAQNRRAVTIIGPAADAAAVAPVPVPVARGDLAARRFERRVN